MKFHLKILLFFTSCAFVLLIVAFEFQGFTFRKPIIKAPQNISSYNEYSQQLYYKPTLPRKIRTDSSLQLSKFANCDKCIVLSVVCCLERANETATMLKSAVTLTSSPLLIIVFVEPPLFSFFDSLLSEWPEFIKKRVTMRIEELKYPHEVDSNKWKFLFKPCSSLRLFFPEILHDIDALIYVDTDVLFLAPLESLWRHFLFMNASHMAGLSQEHEDLATGWYNRFARHPFYGKMGVNSGVMLMNLTRLRKFGWIEYLEPLYNEFNKVMTWGDQDIINIIFHYHPEKLYIFGCEYNYRPDHCMYMSVCKTAEIEGVYTLHGSRGIFHNEKQPAFKAIYDAWRGFTIGNDLRQQLYYPMQRNLLKTLKSNCGKLHSKVLLKKISSLVKL